MGLHKQMLELEITMLHVNFNTNRIDESSLIGQSDTIVLTGAPGHLIKSIKQSATAAGAKYTSDAKHHCSCAGKKIPLGGATCSYKPSVKLATHADFIKGLQDELVKHSKIETKSSTVKQKLDNSIQSLRTELATAFTTNTNFVSDLRDVLEASATFNPNKHYVTTRNVQTALALYSFYVLDTTFGSTEGANKIRKIISVNKESVSRLGHELRILSFNGQSTATRYFVTKAFEATLIKVLHNGQHDVLTSVVDSIQDEIDSL